MCGNYSREETILGGNYSRAETIQGRKLFEEIRYLKSLEFEIQVKISDELFNQYENFRTKMYLTLFEHDY